MRWLPKSFAGQTLAITVAALFAAQILTIAFFGLFVLLPQVKRVAGIMAQSIAAASDAASLSPPGPRAAIIKRLDASDYIDVWSGSMAPPASGPRPQVLERIFMQALADALDDRTVMLWRTDQRHRLWIQVRIGPDLFWVSARPPAAMNPLVAVAVSGFIAFLLALLTVVALQRRMTRPLEALTAAVSAFGSQTPPTPVQERGPIELVALSRGFNGMTARLAAAERERTILLAGISHDLRTPLAKLRLAVEMLQVGDTALSGAAHQHVEEIDRVLGQFLMFARGFEAEPEVAFDLEALLSELVALRAVEGVEFHLVGDPVGEAVGRPEALRRALINLTENAVRHGAPPYALCVERHEGFVDIAVSDHGAGAPAGALEGLRRPFVRGEMASGQGAGSGLGLAIAERVAILHAGALIVANTSPSGFEARLRVVLDCPLAESARTPG
jgi:two-component system, OmpR family, osmolarity sensor histidine kinase EnvZ